MAEWQKRDGLRNTWLGQAPKKRDAKAEEEIRTGSPPSMRELARLIGRRGEGFPTTPHSPALRRRAVEEVQAQLGDGRGAGVVPRHAEWKPTPEETFIWVVTKTDMRWVRSDLAPPR